MIFSVKKIVKDIETHEGSKHSSILEQIKHSSGIGAFLGRFAKYPKWWGHFEGSFSSFSGGLT